METITARKQINGLTRVDMEEYFDDVEVDSLYQWIDRIPLSRPKKNISKDFSDAGRFYFVKYDLALSDKLCRIWPQIESYFMQRESRRRFAEKSPGFYLGLQFAPNCLHHYSYYL